MSLKDELAKTRRDIDDHVSERVRVPEGWEAGVRFDGTSGTVTTGELDGPPDDWGPLLEHFGLDPALFRIADDRIQMASWQGWKRDEQGDAAVSAVRYSYRATIVRRRPDTDPDYDALVNEIRAHKPKKPRGADGSAAMIVCLADWQMGKQDGDGTEGVVHRVLMLIDKLPRRVKALRSIGVNVGTLYVAGMGDIVEGCEGHYPMQPFSVELDRRQQVKVARRLLVKAIKAWAPLFDRVVVLAVPGNHGENRSGGKAFTTFGDNDDTAVFEQAAEIMDTDAFKHVSWVIPNDELTVTLDCAGTIVGFAHGHQATRGSSIPAKIESWWKGQQHGRHPIGDADILITAHYHHFAAKADAGRTWLQCPTLDGGSTWFEHQSGSRTVPGTLSVVVGQGGWNHLEIL